MPLNMNTVGTGSGIGSSSSNGGLIIRNITKESTKLISNVSDIDISTMTFGKTIYSDTVEYSSGAHLRDWQGSGTRYRDKLYITDNSSVLYCYTYTVTDSGTTFIRTEISTPFKVGYYTTMIQLGDYLYFYNYTNENSANVKMLYRFDGTSFTSVHSTNPYTYFFNTTGQIIWSDWEVMMYITPVASSKYDGTVCIVDLYSYSDTSFNNYPSGHSGIFTVDDNGFHLQESHYLGGYYSNESVFLPYGSRYTAMESDYSFSCLTYTNKAINLESYNVIYTINSSSGSYYTRSITKTGTSVLLTNVTNTYVYYGFHKVSYPQYDTLLIAIYPKTQYDSNLGKDVKWFLCTINSGKWVYKSMKGLYTGNFGTNTNNGVYLNFVVDTVNPYMLIASEYRSSSSYTNTEYAQAQAISIDATYNSDIARFQYVGYLMAGDIVYCDDGIISCTKTDNSNMVTVNSTKYVISEDGIYKIITKVYDAYIQPSLIITDKSGNIVYAKSTIQSDGSIVGYFKTGMCVNDTKVTSSKRTTYGPSDRYVITMN